MRLQHCPLVPVPPGPVSPAPRCAQSQGFSHHAPHPPRWSQEGESGLLVGRTEVCALGHGGHAPPQQGGTGARAWSAHRLQLWSQGKGCP